MDMAAKLVYLALGLGMTLLTIWPRADTAIGISHQFASLIILMMIFSLILGKLCGVSIA